MKKSPLLFIPVVFIALVFAMGSCRDASTKADASDTLKKNIPAGPEKIPGPGAPAAAGNADSAARKGSADPDILENIDKHVISKAVYPPPGPNGGISNGTVTIQNTLTDITFQKVMIEVSILTADGKEYRTDYYSVINLEPGMTKTVRIPNTTRGNSVVSHVVKVKSNELTNGELLLVGDHFVPQQ